MYCKTWKIQSVESIFDLLRTGTFSWPCLNSALLHNIATRARAIQVGELRSYVTSESRNSNIVMHKINARNARVCESEALSPISSYNTRIVLHSKSQGCIDRAVRNLQGPLEWMNCMYAPLSHVYFTELVISDNISLVCLMKCIKIGAQ